MNKIIFYPESKLVEETVDLPTPAKQLIPEWYKQSKSFHHGNSFEFEPDGVNPAKTFKLCVPVLDALTTGYIQTTWSDVYITRDQGSVRWAYSHGPEIINARNLDHIQKMPIPEGHDSVPFFWTRPWGIKTPKGYSTLITHPFYGDDLPFKCVTGVIDTDKYHLPGKITFFMRSNFEGLIPAGTPMFQMFPFKRSEWKSIKEPFNQTLFNVQGHDIHKNYVGSYKKRYWQKKTYE